MRHDIQNLAHLVIKRSHDYMQVLEFTARANF